MEVIMLPEGLVCPGCKGELQNNNSIELACKTCNRKFNIIDSIPDFMEENSPNIHKENIYWNKEDHSEDNLYENVSDESCNKIIESLSIEENSKGLELCCGDGPFARRLQNRNLDIYGIDISLNLLKITKNMFPVRGNALKLPFRDSFFDWIIFAFSLHHIPDISRSISEALRVMKPGAKILIIDPNYYHPVRFLTRHPSTILRKHVFKYFSPEERWVPLRKLKKIMCEHNFSIKKSIYYTPSFRNPSFMGHIQNRLCRLFDFSPFNVFVHSYFMIIATRKT